MSGVKRRFQLDFTAAVGHMKMPPAYLNDSQSRKETKTQGACRVYSHVRRYVCGGLFAVLLSGCGGEDDTASRTGYDHTSISVQSMEPSVYGTDRSDDAFTDGALSGNAGMVSETEGLDNSFLMVGATPHVWSLDKWADGDTIPWSDLRGKVVVVRFFDVDSEACQRTMSAIQQLHEEFQDCPVMFIGVLRTTRLDRGPEWNDVVDRVRQWGITFPIARDNRGVTLNQWWLKYLGNVPPTPTFVIGPNGRIIHVQPGPEFHPSDDLMFALCDRDFQTIRLAIQVALPQDVALGAVKSS
jgi:peroxiredoxin